MKRWLPLLLVLALTACGGERVVAPVSGYGFHYDGHKKSWQPHVYTVKKGDTLYSIAWRYRMDYKQLARINGIGRPYTIYPGQKLKFKKTWTARSQKTTASKGQTKKQQQSGVKKTSKQIYTGSKHINWRWPASGKLLSTYSRTDPGRKGIKISGKAGQVVVAAASGKIVYSGNGLPRYGNLLIIKHNDVYLSAYAHNQKLLVKEGDRVKGGQKIALLGHSGNNKRNQLHFEIRRNGKPVDPLRFLPKR